MTNRQKRELADDVDAAERATAGYKVVDGLKGAPAILGCTVLSYLLNFSSCIPHIAQHMESGGLNFGFHASVGSGLYGGYTDNDNRKVASLAVLAATIIPDLYQLAQGQNIEQVGVSAGIKAIGYGLGYLTSKIVREMF